MVSVDCILISILSLSVDALEMLCTVVAEALASRACNLKADDLLSFLRLMCNLRNPNLSCPVQTLITSVSCNMSFASQTRSCTPSQTACDSWRTAPREIPSVLCP